MKNEPVKKVKHQNNPFRVMNQKEKERRRLQKQNELYQTMQKLHLRVG